jgi:predicted ABC-type ATPase
MDDKPVEANPFKQVYANAISDLGKKLDGQRSLVLVRGVSGSGKSTFATHLAAKLGHVVHSTDDFFMQDGAYRFDGSKLGTAHKWTQNNVDKDLEAGKNAVVANTFTQHWEMAPYLESAKKHGAKVHVFNTVFPGKNVHGVPEAGIKRMKDRWEPFEGETILKPDE